MSQLPWWATLGMGGMLALFAVMVLPAFVLAAGLVAWAWWQGWPASRLRNIVLTVLFGALVAVVWSADPLWMWHDVQTAFELARRGEWAQAAGHAAGAELLVATVVAWWWWHGYTHRMQSGTALAKGEKHQRRQQTRRERAASRRVRNENTPLSRDDRVILGQRYEDTAADEPTLPEQVGRRHRPWVEVLMRSLGLHLAVIGQTGAGKTTLLERLSAGWTEAAWRRFAQQSSQKVAGSRAARPRPLTIMVEAKGGREAADQARAWADCMEALGLDAERVGVFPFEQKLNMWNLPAKQMRASLHALAGTDHEYYARLQRGLLHLVVDAPVAGTPKSSADFLRRLDPGWLREQWKGYSTELREIEVLTDGKAGGASPLGSDLILFDDLFRSLGGDFDAGRPLEDFDALYLSLPGTTDTVVASAKAAVLIELLTYELSVRPREVLFILDEFSAVSGETAGSVTNLVERLRQLGGSVIVSSQSYQGLAASDDERDRLLNAMGGGMLVQRTQGPEPLSKRSGTRKVGEVGRKIEDGQLSEEGTVRRQDQFLLDPNRLRKLPDYHVAYVLPERVQWGVVAPLEPTKRLPSSVIVSSPQRALPVGGDAVPQLELRAQRQEVVGEAGGWSA